MDDDRYIAEFFTVLEETTGRWIDSLSSHTRLGPCDMADALRNYVYYRHLPQRDAYCRLRAEGMTSDDAITRLIHLPMPEDSDDGPHGCDAVAEFNACARQWETMLAPLRGSRVYYANFSRMAEYILPFVGRDGGRAVLVTEGEINPAALDLPNNVTVLKFVDSGCRLYRNRFLQRHLPEFFSFANTLLLLDSLLLPPEFYCICGCHTQARIWAAACNARGVLTVCFQHGWPAFMHAGFKRLPYRYMALWGPQFAQLWKPYNPGMKFMISGYPYKVKAEGSRDAVTFFLQEPYFASSPRMVGQIYDLIVATARRSPGLPVHYRLHPESRIDPAVRQRLDAEPGVRDVSDMPLPEVYASTQVAVSHYSSTIMECIAHGCCPLVFNPTPGWNYTPDLEAEGIGFVSTTPDEFFGRLPRAIAHHTSPSAIARWFAPFDRPTP